MNLLVLPAPNSYTDDRWLPILASHVHRGKHHRCVQQADCSAVGPVEDPDAHMLKIIFFIFKSFKSEAEKP